MLRPYQQDIVTQTRESFRKHRGVLIQSETGSGKTVIFSDITAAATVPVWILVHREELLKSAYRSLKKAGMVPGILHPKAPKPTDQRVVVAMVQTLKRRPDISLSHVGLLIIDECHLTDFDLVVPRFPNARRLGFTATPLRKGRQAQLTDFYTKMVSGPSVQNLIDMGFLVPCDTYTYNVVATKNLPTVKGDFDEAIMYSEFDKNIVYNGVIDNWLRLTPNKKTLMFCVNIKHAQSMCAEFNARGIGAKYIVSTGQEGSRSDILDEWRRGEFPVLINASIFTTGFDEPSIECVVLVRATTSENLYRQMIGRGSRTNPGKSKFILLDFGENVDRHGTYNQERKYSLAHKTRNTIGAPIMKECPPCGAYISGSAKICPYCGYEYPLTKAELVEIELAPYVSGSLGEIDVNDLPKLELIRKARKYTPAWVTRQIVVKEPEKARQLIMDYAMMKGYRTAWIYREYSRLLI